MLDVKRLRVLGEVARQGSFSAAAEALYLSQSAVSQQVATLEREVGMPLLERTRNGPKLNEAGKTLVRHAEAALARLEEAEHELKAIAGLEGGELRIASFASASATLLTEALGEFKGRYPEVQLTVTAAEPEDSVPRLRAAEIDLAIESDEYEVQQAYVAAGLGFTLLPDLALPTLRSDLVVRPTNPDAPKRRVWAATRTKGARSAATEAMAGILQRVGERFEANEPIDDEAAA